MFSPRKVKANKKKAGLNFKPEDNPAIQLTPSQIIRERSLAVYQMYLTISNYYAHTCSSLLEYSYNLANLVMKYLDKSGIIKRENTSMEVAEG